MSEKKEFESLARILKQGRVGVLPTDTLYGLVGRAEDKKAVARIKKLKKRSAGKPFIILISSLKDLAQLGVKLNKETEKFLKAVWPGPVSVVLEKNAFRLPKNKFLQALIKQTGPLVAPSANPEGSPPAETIKQAKEYFGDQVDFYLSAGKKLSGQPSTLIRLAGDKIEILRPGRKKIPPTY